MKVLGISAGTNGGSNDAMCKEALMGAKELGAEIEFINVHKLNIRHCTGCKACVMSLFSGRGNACVLKDDFQWLVAVSYTHLTLPTTVCSCRSRWSPYH